MATFTFRSWGMGTDAQVVATDTYTGAASARTANGNATTLTTTGSESRIAVTLSPKYGDADASGSLLRGAIFDSQFTRASQQDVNDVLALTGRISWSFPKHVAQGKRVKLAISSSNYQLGCPNMYGMRSGFIFTAKGEGFISVPARETYTIKAYADDIIGQDIEKEFYLAGASTPLTSVDEQAAMPKATLKVTSTPSGAQVQVR